MFVSFGVLQFDDPLMVPMQKEWGKKKRKLNRAQDCEALRRFCLLINPSGVAFHPHFLLNAIPEVDSFPLDFNLRRELIRGLLDKSYAQAMDRHKESGSLGPAPNRINISLMTGFKHGRVIVTWTSSGGEMRTTLTLYRGHNSRPSLQIVGKFERQVKVRAGIAGISEPTFNRKWYGIQSRNEQIASPQIERQESEFEKLMKVKVPVGDFLDFLRKYQR